MDRDGFAGWDGSALPQDTAQRAIENALQQSLARMQQFARWVAELGPHFIPGSELDKAIETERSIMAQFAEYAGRDPAIAQALADLARAGGSKTLH